MAEERGTLEYGEPHPSAWTAKQYLSGLGTPKLWEFQEAFAGCAIEGNRPAEICSETLRRLLASEPVSDRYLLGLAWAIRDMEEQDAS